MGRDFDAAIRRDADAASRRVFRVFRVVSNAPTARRADRVARTSRDRRAGAEASSTSHDSSFVRPSVTPCVRHPRYIVYIYGRIRTHVNAIRPTKQTKQKTNRPRSRARSRATSSTFHPSNDTVDARIRRRHRHTTPRFARTREQNTLRTPVLNVGHHRSRRARTPRAHE